MAYWKNVFSVMKGGVHLGHLIVEIVLIIAAAVLIEELASRSTQVEQVEEKVSSLTKEISYLNGR